MKKIINSLSILLVSLIGGMTCNNAQELYKLEQQSLVQKEDIIPYIAIKNKFKWSAQEVLTIVQQSPKTQRLLSDKTLQLLIESFPTQTEPLFVINIRQTWNGMSKRLVAFRVHAQTGLIRVETPLFSEAYNRGEFDISLQEWEQE